MTEDIQREVENVLALMPSATGWSRRFAVERVEALIRAVRDDCEGHRPTPQWVRPDTVFIEEPK